MVNDVVCTCSVTPRIGRPYAPPTAYATSHHSWVASVSTPARTSAASPSRGVACPCVHTANGTQRVAATTTKKTELPLSDAHIVTVRANTAGQRQPPRSTARAIAQTNQPSAA